MVLILNRSDRVFKMTEPIGVWNPDCIKEVTEELAEDLLVNYREFRKLNDEQPAVKSKKDKVEMSDATKGLL